jgi:hypothetical protein
MPDSENQNPTVLPDSGLRTLFVDNLAMNSRTDGMHQISLYAGLPGGWSEQARIMVSDQHLSSMLAVLTKHCKSWQEGSKTPDNK